MRRGEGNKNVFCDYCITMYDKSCCQMLGARKFINTEGINPIQESCKKKNTSTGHTFLFQPLEAGCNSYPLNILEIDRISIVVDTLLEFSKAVFSLE